MYIKGSKSRNLLTARTNSSLGGLGTVVTFHTYRQQINENKHVGYISQGASIWFGIFRQAISSLRIQAHLHNVILTGNRRKIIKINMQTKVKHDRRID